MFAYLLKSARPCALLAISMLAASAAVAPAAPASAATRSVVSAATSLVQRLLHPGLLLDSNGRPLAALRAQPRSTVLGKRGDSTAYTFATIDDPTNASGTNLYGISNNGTIVGFFGGNTPTDPDIGLKMTPPYLPGNFKREQFGEAPC